MKADRFNFIYDFKHHPNYRVEYETKNGTPSISSPAIFENDEDAIATALKESPDYVKIGLNVIIVLKYEKDGLKEIFRKVA
jgi:hypothetical protein